MPLPILPPDLRARIPSPSAALCGRFVPGITKWMEDITTEIEYLFEPKTGRISCDFAADLCELPCIGGGASSDTCQTVTFDWDIVSSSTQLAITINVAGMDVGWAWSLARYTASDYSGVPVVIGSGTTTGSTITDTDTGLSNGTPYYYRLTVTESGCDPQTSDANGTPALCRTLNLSLSIDTSAAVAGELYLNVVGETGIGLPSGTTYSIFRSQAADELGSLVASGSITGSDPNECTVDNGSTGLCFHDTGLTQCTRYYYTVRIQQDPTCHEYEMKTNGFAYSAGPTAAVVFQTVFTTELYAQTSGGGAPVHRTANIGARWAPVANAAYYLVISTRQGDLVGQFGTQTTYVRTTDTEFRVGAQSPTYSNGFRGPGFHYQGASVTFCVVACDCGGRIEAEIAAAIAQAGGGGVVNLGSFGLGSACFLYNNPFAFRIDETGANAVG